MNLPAAEKSNRLLWLLLVGFFCGGVLAADRQDHLSREASGGVNVRGVLCPAGPTDTIIALDAPGSLAESPGADIPQMTVDGLWELIHSRDINDIGQLLQYFPDDYRNNFSLVEHTRATGQSNLIYPRIVLFGADGHFLLNIGTKPGDPKYDLLDVAQLHEESGRWEFSVFDFSGEAPRLRRDDSSCVECHGSENSRPVWGSNMNWPGVFGDNIAAGPQGEALDTRHLEQMQAIIAGEGKSPRFDFLDWRDEPLRRGGKRRIARHAFGAELILSNIAMGSATARGAFLRLRSTKPSLYRQLKHRLIYSYFARKGHVPWSNARARALGLPADTRAEQAMDLLLARLGLDTTEAFSLATLHHLEPPRRTWSMGRGDLHDLLALQILDDLRREDPAVAKILAGRRVEEGILGCPDTAKNIADVVQFKMLHLFQLRGHHRFLVHEQFYPLDLEDVYTRVFLPVAHPLLAYISDFPAPAAP